MHVINYPDRARLACDVCQHCIQLPAYNSFTVPNFPNYYLGPLVGSACDSLTNAIVLTHSSPELTLFPVPAKELCYLQGASPTDQILIHTISGEEVSPPSRWIEGSYFEINTSLLPPGIYYIQIINEKRKIIKKLVKVWF